MISRFNRHISSPSLMRFMHSAKATAVAMLADHANHPLDLAKLDPDLMLSVMISSFEGDEKKLAGVIRSLIA